MTRDEIVAAIQSASRALDTTRLRERAFRQKSGIAKSAWQRHFDTWSSACEAAGVEPGPTAENLVPTPRIAEQACLEEMQRVAKLLGTTRLSTTQFNGYAKFTSKAVTNRFGRWAKALEAAGLEACEKAERDRPLSVEDAVGELRRVAHALSKSTLTSAEFDSNSEMTSYRVIRVVGSWRAALVASGLQQSPNLKEKIPLAALATKFLNVTIELGQMPTLVQLVRRTGHATDTWSRNRGGYAAFRRAAIDHLVSERGRIPPAVKLLFDADLAVARTPVVAGASIRPDASGSLQYVPSVCANLIALSMNQVPASMAPPVVAATEFEKECGEAFGILGYDVMSLGQGHGRQPDFIARASREHYAVIVDAKAYADGFVLGTEDRKFLDYATNHGDQLRRDGIERVYFAVVSSSFRVADVTKLRKALASRISGFVFLTAAALVRMVGAKVRSPNGFTLGGIEHVFLRNGIEE